ncbi:unnamed protein product [Darwinula stevensoni]|uniref:Uncharacterized protein n=1 Tax=Darwinula stevensoni TaxID=69355 RepID=A0A7R8X8C0_9CRUS|nr:unnamed protein product [Darwinula stevensoni]CAG0888604.1 unnamed protein product [Darwinula stevensoni]
MDGYGQHFPPNGNRPKKNLWTTVRGSSRDFWLSTSIPGLTNARRHQNPAPKLLWLTVFLIGAAFTVYSGYQVVADYLSYPVITYVSMNHAPRMPFPAVTVCNSNPIVCYKLAQFRDQLPELWNASGCEVTSAMFTKLTMALTTLNATEFKAALDRYLQGEMGNMTDLVFAIVDDAGDYSYAGELTSLLNFLPGNDSSPMLHMILSACLCAEPAAFKAGNGSKAFDALMSYAKGAAVATSGTRQSMGAGTAGGSLNSGGSSSRNSVASTSNTTRKRSIAGAGNTAGTYNQGAQENSTYGQGSNPHIQGNGPVDIASATTYYVKYVKLMEAFSKVNDSLKQRITPSLTMLIWRCTFQGTDCLQDGFFQKIMTPQYGACYMFNTAWNPSDSDGGQRISGKTGEETGLSLEVFIDQDNYIPNPISSSAGARITIHSPDQLPNPVEQGYFVQPNTHTVFGLQIVNMSRLPSPYVTNCVSNWTETDFEPLPSGFNQNISNQNFIFGYSQVGKNLGIEDIIAQVLSDPTMSATVKGTMQKDMLKVEIFFRSLNLQVIQEKPKYDLYGLVSNLGGVVGIYLGMCVVMLIEILEFLAFLLYDIIRYFLGKDSRDEQQIGGLHKSKELGAPPANKSYNQIIASMYPVSQDLPPPVYHRKVWGSQ